VRTGDQEGSEPQTEKVAGVWRNKCIMRSFIICTAHQIKKDEMNGSCSTHWKVNAYKVLVRQYKGKRPLGRSTRKPLWEVIKFVHNVCRCSKISFGCYPLSLLKPLKL